MRRLVPYSKLLSAAFFLTASWLALSNAATKKQPIDLTPIEKSDEEWKKILTPEQYEILRKKGTERAFTGKLWNNHKKGVYLCAACQLPLFASETKFESGTGWPSFWQPIDEKYVIRHDDTTYGMMRTEVVCARCGGHLGHVFDDGPPPTGLRYCINSASLSFTPKK